MAKRSTRKNVRLNQLAELTWNDVDLWAGDYEPEPAPDIPVSRLKKQTKAQLVELIVQIAGRSPEVAREIRDRLALRSGDADPLVKGVRQEIGRLTAEPGWQDPWHGEGYTPDYTGVARKLRTPPKEGLARSRRATRGPVLPDSRTCL